MVKSIPLGQGTNQSQDGLLADRDAYSPDLQSQFHAVILLASGLSKRLGIPKQLLTINNQSLLEVMVRLALQHKPNIVIVVIPDNHDNIIKVAKKLALLSNTIKLIYNANSEIGMGQSLQLGAKALIACNEKVPKFDRVLIMGVDQILLDANHVKSLLLKKAKVVASSYSQDYYQVDDAKLWCKQDNSSHLLTGIPIVIDFNLLKQWQLRLSGDKGFRPMIRALKKNELTVVINHKLSVDIDTKEQLNLAKYNGWLD